jgi:hypothetical protein
VRVGLAAIVALATLAIVAPAHANSTWYGNFHTAYPAAVGTRIDSCTLCHTSAPALNPYGSAYATANHNFTTIASADSDGDTFSNSVEIAALFFPGNAADHPAPAPDTTLPVVSGFSIPVTSASLTVGITSLTATDNVAVTGYLVNQSATKPASGAAGWTTVAPTSYTFAAAGAQTLYAYAKDAAGNVSNGVAATVTITLPPVPDTTLPVVSGFSLPATSASLTVGITSLTATDNVAVTGYLVNQSATRPAAGAAGWTTVAPTSYTFAAAGAQTLYAYAKDAAGNVSNGLAATVTITLPPPPDTSIPVVTVFTMPTTSTSLAVPIISLTGIDNVGVTGYLVTQSATKPAAGDAAWAMPRPASYTFAAAGAQTLYAYAKDAAGNVSNAFAATVTITLPPAPDTTLPVVSAFSVPATSASLTVPITGIVATDNVGVTGFLVNQSATKPASGAAGWTTAAPTSYTFAADGAQTLHAYAKDAAGNVSNGVAATVTITIPPPPTDTTAPTVSTFSVSPTSTSLTVPVLAFAATDDTAVTGYLITESSTQPAAGAAGWQASAPATYAAASGGVHTLYAYAKDAAGNVSAGVSSSVTITVASGTGILFTDLFTDATTLGDRNWEPVSGRFIGRSGAFTAVSTEDNLTLVRDVIALDPFLGGRIQTVVRFTTPTLDTVGGIVFDYQDADHYRYVLFNLRRRTITVGAVSPGGDGDQEEDQNEGTTVRVVVPYIRSGWHKLKVDLDSTAGTVKVYLDAATKPAVTKTFASVGEGRVGLVASHARLRASFDNFRVQDASVLP